MCYTYIYQWIRLNELYKLIWSFFQISESFFEFVKKNYTDSVVAVFGLCKRGRGGICAEQHAF